MGNNDRYIRYYTLLAGIAFTIAGIGGFIEGFTQPIPADAPHLIIDMNYGLLLGLFPINILHNFVHLAIGIGGLLTFRNTSHARRYLQVFAVLLLIFTVMGLVPQLNTTFGLVPLFGHDIWLHGAEAIIALYLGFFVKWEPAATLKKITL